MADLWAITAYFNPTRSESRRRNYRAFRQHLDAPLVTVEWSAEGRFELDAADAEILVPVRGGDLMWQKERLLAAALERVPPQAEAVAWLDGDVIMTDPTWSERALEALRHSRAVQLFSEVRYLDPSATRALLEGDRTAAPERVKVCSARVLAEVGPDAFFDLEMADRTGRADGRRPPRRGNPGMAWAARRDLLLQAGFFERAVVGGGDLFWFMAAIGRTAPWLEASRDLGLGYLARSSFPRWAAAAHAVIEGRIGFVDAPLLHLDHGRIQDRQYLTRDAGFDRLGVDIDRDLAAEGLGAPWSFTGRSADARAFMRRYFESRNDDRAPAPAAEGATA